MIIVIDNLLSVILSLIRFKQYLTLIKATLICAKGRHDYNGTQIILFHFRTESQPHYFRFFKTAGIFFTEHSRTKKNESEYPY